MVLSGRASDLTLQRFNHLTTRSATSYTPEPQAAPACIGERTLTEDSEGNKAWSWVLQPLRYLRFLLFRSEIIQTAAKPFVPIRVIRVLLLVGGNLWQLRREEAFLFFLVQRQSRGRDDLRGDEDDQVLFGVLFRIGAKCSADERNVANDGNLILRFLDVLAHQPANHYGLPIIDTDACRHLARAEDWLVNDVSGQLDRPGNGDTGNTSNGIDTNCIDRAAVVDEAFELDDLRNQVEINCRRVSSDDRFNF